MEQQKPTGRTCAACGSPGYAFRSRRQIEAEPGKEETVTKYRRKACAHEWRVKVSSAEPGNPS